MHLGRLVFWVLAILAGLLFVAFAVNNFHIVAVDLWPAPLEARMPVFLLVFCAIFVGLLAGAGIAWAATGATRRKARERRRAVDRLSGELDQARRALPGPGTGPDTASAR